ncbi:hypothetical protein GOP47_0009320 [Adiantum capillus-veneris]|uniref:Uncharacterized protein n=1 Tax=Adiantum capillus-veneris TaxID=13818 RepID=A0A9D4UWD5_ADICA|nr:hypothetical protein GOP47_0009320 [Adiantum capillus-veneris]
MAAGIDGAARDSSCAVVAGEISARREGAGGASTRRGAIAGECAVKRCYEEGGVGERGAVDREEVCEPEQEETPCSGETEKSRSVGGSGAEAGVAGADVEEGEEVGPESMWRRRRRNDCRENCGYLD